MKRLLWVRQFSAIFDTDRVYLLDQAQYRHCLHCWLESVERTVWVGVCDLEAVEAGIACVMTQLPWGHVSSTVTEHKAVSPHETKPHSAVLLGSFTCGKWTNSGTWKSEIPNKIRFNLHNIFLSVITYHFLILPLWNSLRLKQLSDKLLLNVVQVS